MAEAFDEERTRRGMEKLNWQMGEGRNFKALSEIYNALKPLAELKREGRAMEPAEMFDGVRIFFHAGYEYLAEITKHKGGSVAFMPHTLSTNFNQIIHHARNNARTTGTPKSKYAIDADAITASVLADLAKNR